jgi:holo-[acyl-carrier protein] synthase
MILGVGVDLASVARFERLLARHGEALAARILGAEEAASHARARRPARDLAKRWAVKEAYAKALGTGLAGIAARDIALTRAPDGGAPRIRLSAAGRAFALARGAGAAHLSLSDEGDQVIAMVVIERASGAL